MILTVAAVALSGCANFARPSVSSALVDAGARPAVADCMAVRMTDRLSITQLKKLERIKPASGEKANDLSAAELIGRVNRIGDPEVVTVIAAAGAVCSATS